MIDSNDVNDLQLEDVADYSADYATKDFPEGDDNLHNQDNLGSGKVHYRRNRIMALLRANKWFLLLVGILLGVLIIVVSVAGGGSKKSSSSKAPAATERAPVTQPPIVVDPATLDEVVLDELLVKLLAIYEDNDMPNDAVKDDSTGTTPQKLAYWWLASDKTWDSLSTKDLTQRYALATFYYATNYKENAMIGEGDDGFAPWTDAYLWLSEEHTCEWKGIECAGNKEVTKIKLEENGLTGSLPIELSLVGKSIVELDLTSNFIHMQHSMYDVFETFVNLEIFFMDDNFLQTFNNGLPWQFRKLTSLIKVRLSYNLLEGDLTKANEVFKAWKNLEHLEIESNYFEGDMPPAIVEMTNLVYLYMRRNDMTINLDFLKAGTLVNLFAVWLDNNKISGQIPTEIGTIGTLASLSITIAVWLDNNKISGQIPTEIGTIGTLASLSITNSTTLGGPIPTEMGNLSELRRVWLFMNKLTGKIPAEMENLSELEVFEVYGNNLSGSMPQGICDNVRGSGYDRLALTSDCKAKVQCSLNCCTDCF
eukprot:CAMPEP_0198135044 /NCGR_PEP_ID=MMETSP1442-20131203/60386_1 /TAXON_ID= /ORGANISM="Craspedostauros australis, Strain CCMP3328" /LENGTH=535 /DNA_ID=CAMNT_0043796203 /DNA_START=18 /DNA_END=1625 /DNA_ORIENTATION=+